MVADAPSRLDLIQEPEVLTSEILALDKDEISSSGFPASFKRMQREQAKDERLLEKANKPKTKLSMQKFHGGSKDYDLITCNGKTVIPASLQQETIDWHHNTLLHPGANRTEKTIRNNFTWKNLTKQVEDACLKCHTCQLTKRINKKYGKLPPKEAEIIPWDTLCIDLIGPYKIERKNKPDLTLWCLTMIDPATGWFEIAELPDKRADIIANLLETTWLVRYPWPNKVINDRGTEFMAEVKKMLKEEYDIKQKLITTRSSRMRH